MRHDPWGLWPELERLRRESDDAFRRRGASSRRDFPLLNVWTGAEGAVLTTELPGIDPGQLEISVLGDTMTLKGHRDQPEAGSGSTFHRRERGFGAFSRTVQLAFRIDPEAVTASYANGVLEILVPKAEEDRAKTIPVTAS